MTKNGYSNTTVDDIIKEARVSRATFYQHFESKQDCFMSGYARMHRHVIDAILTTPTSGNPMDRFATMLDRYLGFVALDPPTARLYLLEVYAAGPEAMRRRVDLQQEFVAGVAKVFKARSKADHFACQALVAAISSLVTNALTDGDTDAVVALKKPILGYAERVMGPALVGPA
jgi:AcrR family transcriptional regulator